MDANGDFVIAFEGYGDGGGLGIYARRYNASGNPLDANEFLVNTHTTNTQQLPSAAMEADGDFVIAWESYGQDGSDYGIYAQRFSASGSPNGGEFLINTHTTGSQSGVAAAMDVDGDLVVAWQSAGQDGSGNGVYAQRFNSAGGTNGGVSR
jgi:hypothetical protein